MTSLKIYSFATYVLFGAFFIQSAEASVINIFEDQTDAYASVTYDPGAASNPGATTNSFSGALFDSGGFVGYDVSTTRQAIVNIPDGSSDTTDYTAANEFREVSGEYIGGISIGTGSFNQLGTTGLSEAEIDTTLRFMVTDGSANIFLWSELFTSSLTGTSSIQLVDETTSSLVVNLAAPDYNYESATYTLEDAHTYRLLGYAFAYTPHSGDPYSSFGFNFGDAAVRRSVPEPSALALMAIGLIAIRFTCRKNVA